MVDPELKLEGRERAALAVMTAMEGFHALKKLMESEVAKFAVKLINTKAEDEAAVLAAHKMCKAAAQFYQGIMDRVNAEVEAYTHTPRAGDPPMADVTADLFTR